MSRPDAKSILIADDDWDLVSVVSVRCRLMGLKVMTASDAFTALSLVRSKMPDLVCLDVGMPGGNGLSVCEMIASDPTFREIPVIVLTGRSDPQTICRCHSMNAYYVEKSIDTWGRLEPLIRSLLEMPAGTAQVSGVEAAAEGKPSPAPLNLSADAKHVSAPLLLTPAVPLAESAAPWAPMEEADVPSAISADSCHRTTGSAEFELTGPISFPELERRTPDPSHKQEQSLNVTTESHRAMTTDAVTEHEAREERSAEPVSQHKSEMPAETERAAEPSCMWRQLAQVVGLVVGRTPEEHREDANPPTDPEEPATQADTSPDVLEDGIWHDTVRLSFESTLAPESTPPVESSSGDVPAIPHDDLLGTVLRNNDQESGDGQSAGNRIREAVPLRDLDEVWSRVGQATNGSPSSGSARDQFAKSASSRKHQKMTNTKKPGAQEKTLIIADDDCDLVQMLVLRCEQIGLHVFRSPDAMHALLGAHRVQPDLLILDVNMPGGNGLSVCEMMAGDPALAKTPVIIMTGDTNADIPRRCQALHAHYLQKGPGLWERLEPLLRKTLGMPAAIAPKATAGPVEAKQKPRILCIDDDPDISKLLKLRLEPYGVDVLRAFKGMQGYWTALDMRPDLVILDMVMPDGGGNYILGRLRAHPLTEKVPVLMLTGVNTPGTRRQMFGLGVDGYLTKPIDSNALIEHVGQYVTLRGRNGAPLVQRLEPLDQPDASKKREGSAKATAIP